MLSQTPKISPVSHTFGFLIVLSAVANAWNPEPKLTTVVDNVMFLFILFCAEFSNVFFTLPVLQLVCQF